VSLETLLVVFVGFSALALVIQSFAMWRAFNAWRDTVQHLNTQSENIRRDIQEITHQLRQTSESLRPLGQTVEELNAHFQETGQLMRTRVEDLDQFIQELMQIGREQALKFDYVVTDTVQKFEQTTDMIKRDVVRPALQVSSFIKGIGTGLAFLFRDEKSEADRRDEKETTV
jgi:methyl-accepting chemotaxis protein